MGRQDLGDRCCFRLSALLKASAAEDRHSPGRLPALPRCQSWPLETGRQPVEHRDLTGIQADEQVRRSVRADAAARGIHEEDPSWLGLQVQKVSRKERQKSRRRWEPRRRQLVRLAEEAVEEKRRPLPDEAHDDDRPAEPDECTDR